MKRLRNAVAVLLALLIAGAVAVGIWAMPKGSVDLPKPDAAPDAFAAAWFEAYNVRDFGTANRIRDWRIGRLDRTGQLKNPHFGKPVIEGDKATVPVTFIAKGMDISMPDGRYEWTITLTRKPGFGWQITDWGI